MQLPRLFASTLAVASLAAQSQTRALSYENAPGILYAATKVPALYQSICAKRFPELAAASLIAHDEWKRANRKVLDEIDVIFTEYTRHWAKVRNQTASSRKKQYDDLVASNVRNIEQKMDARPVAETENTCRNFDEIVLGRIKSVEDAFRNELAVARKGP
ncbi:hypothetical protein [Ideonella alba]|uniref:Uncharacterized protein n=1 Tax=Ideonella alba TaxID=2824118 RepID=A0A941BNF5_9BURK|nr:hypothetical protein [Ideonella alba]MBQ0933274.1 hypothetical protein [Ideonella alba]